MRLHRKFWAEHLNDGGLKEKGRNHVIWSKRGENLCSKKECILKARSSEPSELAMQRETCPATQICENAWR